MSEIDLAAMLDAKQTGANRWLAKCPAHDDSRASLSIRQCDDGTWLLHDFAGCDSLSICHTLGIEFRDLFPAKRIRRIEHRKRPRLSAADALSALDHEARVISIIGADFLDHREIDKPTWDRLAQAVARIASARALCCPERIER